MVVEASEVFPQYPIIFLGGGSGFGRTFAKDLALNGYEVIVGTRDEGKFQSLREEVLNAGGKEPRQLIANITNFDEVSKAYHALELPLNEPLHYFAIAAEGLKEIRKRIFRLTIPLIKAARDGSVPVEMAELATAQIREFITQPESMAPAMRVNHEGLTKVCDLLIDHGHIAEDSSVLTTSSSISHDTDPDNPENYPGPWFYYPIAVSKEKGVRALRHMATALGASHIDVVAPAINKTGVGDLIGELANIIEVIGEGRRVELPNVDQEVLSGLLLEELNRRGAEKIRTVFADGNRLVNTRPGSWNNARFPYL